MIEDDDIQDYVRPWVGLTEEEIEQILEAHEQDYDWIGFARAIEKKLKDKQ